jgi:hypothetical protein
MVVVRRHSDSARINCCLRDRPLSQVYLGPYPRDPATLYSVRHSTIPPHVLGVRWQHNPVYSAPHNTLVVDQPCKVN